MSGWVCASRDSSAARSPSGRSLVQITTLTPGRSGGGGAAMRATTHAVNRDARSMPRAASSVLEVATAARARGPPPRAQPVSDPGG